MLFTNVWQILPFEPLIKQFGNFFSDENLPSSVGPFALSLFTDYPNSSSFNNCSWIFEIYEHYQTHFSSHVFITTIPLLNTPPPFLYLFGEVLIKVESGPTNNYFLVLVLGHTPYTWQERAHPPLLRIQRCCFWQDMLSRPNLFKSSW